LGRKLTSPAASGASDPVTLDSTGARLAGGPRRIAACRSSLTRRRRMQLRKHLFTDAPQFLIGATTNGDATRK
jgi:hypothetical protein